MLARRTILPVVLAALTVAVGCTRAQTRRAPRPLAPAAAPAQEFDGRGLAAAPSPPTPPAPQPPPSPGVTPPRSDAIARGVPPMPGPRNDAPGDLAFTPTSGSEVAIAAGPIRDRIRERREERKQRRDEREQNEKKDQEPERTTPDKKDPDPAPPFPPAVPDRPAPPPAVPDRPLPAVPSQSPLLHPLPAVPNNPLPVVTVPPGAPSALPANPAATEPAGTSARQIVEASAKRWAEVTDFEARLVKREVVNGKQLPTDEIEYRFRRQPHSVYMKVLSEAGQGREVLYVHGKYGNQMHVVTGKGDNVLVGAGYKTEVDPDSRTATSKSRHRIYEAGMGRTIAGLTKNIDSVKPLGPVQRKEYPYPLEGVEQTIRPGTDPLLPRGGRRQVYFDPKPESPSYMLPVLVTTQEPDGREVEYYAFDRMKVPAGLTDADWTPERLGKRR